MSVGKADATLSAQREKNKKERIKMPAGRPKKFKTARAMQRAVDKYFKECEQTGANVKLTSLARAIGLTPQSLINYGARDEFAEVVQDARLRVEEVYEERNIERGRPGDMFALQQFGWNQKIKHEIDENSKLSMEMQLKKLEGERF